MNLRPFLMSIMGYFDPTEATAHVDSLLLRYLGRLKESEIEERESLNRTEIQHCETQNAAPAKVTSRFSEAMLKEALVDMKEQIESLQYQLDQSSTKLRAEEDHRSKVRA